MGGMARALAASGHEALVLADHIRGQGLIELDWPAGVVLRRFGGARPLRRLRKGWAAHRALTRMPVRAVVADSWKSLEVLPRPPVPSLVLAHGSEFPPSPSASKRRRIERALSGAGAIAPNSAFTEGLLRPYLTPAAPRPVVVHLPIPPQPDPPPEARAMVAGLRGEGPLLLTVARLEPRKGIDAVIRALPSLAAEHPGLRYAIAGEGEDRARLASLAREVGVAERVRFLGRVDDATKAALYAGADLFAMPTRREGASVEGYGLVYLEAGWYGLPSLAGRDGGSAEAVQDGETGLVRNGADPAAVAEALGRLLGDEALRRRLGAAAAARVRRDLGWEAVLPRYLALLGLSPGG